VGEALPHPEEADPIRSCLLSSLLVDRAVLRNGSMPEMRMVHASHRGILTNVEFENESRSSIPSITHRPDKVEVTSGQVLEPAIIAKT